MVRATLKRSMQIMAVVGLGTTGMGGCAATDQIEFQGKIFEMAGLTNREKKETVPVERAPLVIPPTKQLPQPGPRQAAASPQNWPMDPDEVAGRPRKAKAHLEPMVRLCCQQLAMGGRPLPARSPRPRRTPGRPVR